MLSVLAPVAQTDFRLIAPVATIVNRRTSVHDTPSQGYSIYLFWVLQGAG
jgi:hypothetical protein